MEVQEPLTAILSCMPPHIRPMLERSKESYARTAQEITLRADRPLCIYCADARYYLTASGCLVGDARHPDLVTLSAAELRELFVSLCEYSVYSHQDELIRGYINAAGGVRVGVCGSAVMRGGEVGNIVCITTLSFRVPREVKGCSRNLLGLIDPLRGVLICGAPCTGKTTVIRDAARELSTRYRVSVVDERGELAGRCACGFCYDIGLCDVYVGMPKREAMLCAVRSMAPDLIVCDELGGADDVESVRCILRCGAACIATVHASSIEDLRSRPVMRELLSSGAFGYVVFLSERRFSGRVSRIYEWSAADA